MLTFILIVIAVFMTLYYFSTVKRVKWAFSAAVILFVVFSILAVILPTNGVRGTDIVAEIPTGDWNIPIEKIYYDSETDIYFCLKMNLWNPLNINERVVVNYEKMEEYLEIQRECDERLSQLNILE